MRGLEGWREWLNGFADAQGVTTAELVDRALAEMAKRAKHAAPPDRT